jgi:hypothetical protein
MERLWRPSVRSIARSGQRPRQAPGCHTMSTRIPIVEMVSSAPPTCRRFESVATSRGGSANPPVAGARPPGHRAGEPGAVRRLEECGEDQGRDEPHDRGHQPRRPPEIDRTVPPRRHGEDQRHPGQPHEQGHGRDETLLDEVAEVRDRGCRRGMGLRLTAEQRQGQRRPERDDRREHVQDHPERVPGPDGHHLGLLPPRVGGRLAVEDALPPPGWRTAERPTPRGPPGPGPPRTRRT